jgi:transposase
MLQRHAVQVLLGAKHTQKETATLTGVSERSVRRIAQEPPVDGSGGADVKQERSVGRPSVAAAFSDKVKRILAEEPELKTVEILHRLRGAGYKGGKTAAYDLVKSLRPGSAEFMVRFEGLPGEFTQHDFGEVWVTFADSQRHKVRFFASRLKYSRWVEVTVVPDQKVETLVRAVVAHFEAIGGIPLLAVFDRPKTIAQEWDKAGRVTKWNDTFAQSMFSLGVGVELCWPYRANEKGSVENLVGWVKGSFFKQRRFVDMADLLAQLAEWLHEANHVRPCRATGEIPAARMVAERARLRPLKVTSDELALPFPTSVGPTAKVVMDGRSYSMPPATIGLPATLHLYRDRVRIVAGGHSAEHERLLEPGASSTLPEHRALQVDEVPGQRGKRYLKRQHLLDLGQAATDLLTELVHRRPETWPSDVDVLHVLLQTHGEMALRSACQRALDQQVFGAEYVKVFLESPDAVQPVRCDS